MSTVVANPVDVDTVEAIIKKRYRVGDTFTQNDLRHLIGATGMQLTSHSAGAVFQWLKKRGVIAHTGHWTRSTNGKSRGNTLVIWRRAS